MVKQFRYPACLLAALMLFVAAFASVTTAPGTSTSPAVTTAPAEAGQIRAKAFEQLLSGKFQPGRDLLASARKLQPDPVTDTAWTLTGEYLDLSAAAEAEREAELAAAVARVRLAKLAQQYRPKLVEQKLLAELPEQYALASQEQGPPQPLFDRLEGASDAVLATNRQLAGNLTSQPADARKQVLEDLRRAEEELAAAEALVGDGHGEWGRAFRDSAGKLRAALAEYRQAWRTVRLPQGQPALKSAFEEVQGGLIDLGALTSGDPLAAALMHAREAKELSDDGEKFLQQEWARKLIEDAEKRGEELLGQGKWTEALTIYGRAGLGDLDPDNLAYQEKVKRISQHVRVLSFYDEAPAANAADAQTTEPAEPTTQAAMVLPDKPRWQEMIAGIDTLMVQNALRKIDSNYVENPDYRKMGIAALEAVKILCQTPKAAEALPALKDAAKRSAFLEGLENQIGQLEKLPTVDHLHVSLALNRILDLNADTLNLPPEVINMEFADAMTGQLDRFTTMIWPYELEDFRKRTMGSFFGIGVQIRKDAGKPIEVVAPLADTPAFRAGLQAGDLILRVDGRGTRTMKIEQAVKLNTGPRHTKVVLTIQRGGTPKPFDVGIVRDEIHIQTVKGWRRLPDGKWDYFLDRQAGVGYVRVTQFTGDTVEDIRKALRDLRTQQAKGVVLDLRLNPGGLLSAAVGVADEFLSRGLIVRTKGRNVSDAQKSASALGEYQKGKLVVLVNRISASAAEIVSGALKDWGRATVVGERTYGKASVQRLIPLRPKRARLKLTTAHYYLPSGTPLHRTNGAKTWGVEPDVKVVMTPRQMSRWLGLRRETDLLKSVDADDLTVLLDQQLHEDLPLQTALLLLRLNSLSQAG